MDIYGSELIETANKLGINPAALDTVIFAESGRKLTAVNSNGGATGLIQFIPSTARSLGTSTSEIYNMNYAQQFDLIYKYFVLQMQYNKISKINRNVDVYLLVFYPKAVNKPLNYVLPLTQKEYLANKGLDTGKKGYITVQDIQNRFDKMYKYEYSNGIDIAENLVDSYIPNTASAALTIVEEDPKKFAFLATFVILAILFSIYNE